MRKNYKTHIFDCDGVILDSNSIKGDAFHQVASKYSRQHAAKATNYYKSTAGTPRIDKVHYFFEVLLKEPKDPEKIDNFLKKFNKISLENLYKCEKIQGVDKYLSSIGSELSFVVSGAPQDELRTILQKQNLHSNFKEILGSPTLKHINVKYLIEKYNIDTNTAVFFGDSKVDYESASMHGIDFVFVSGKTEFRNYKEYFKDKNVKIINNFTDLL